MLYRISFGLILILGGATLFFHNPSFIKWKPTAIYWVSAVVFLGTTIVGKKPLIQRMIDGNIELPQKIWVRLNVAWALFFCLIGALNLYVAYYYDTNTWVNFKLFGCTGLTLIFVFIQAMYITRHVIEKDAKRPNSLKNNEPSSQR